MSLRIVFMGTPEFAVPALDTLLRNGFNIVGVVTSTHKLGGRGKNKVIESAIKKYAVSNMLYIMQPPNLKSPSFIERLRSLNADLQVVVAFRMLPEVVWNMPRLGTINLHASLLPNYRGAAPINWAIINGESESGLTTFFLRHEIDTGDIILQEKMSIGINETAGELHDRMMQDGASLVLKSVKLIEAGQYELKKQHTEAVTLAPKLNKENCQIDFNKTAAEVHNFVRGLSPFPGAWTTFEGQILKIIRTISIDNPSDKRPGTVETDGKEQFFITCNEGRIQVLELQLQGRRRMSVSDFLNGLTIPEGTILG